MGESSMAGVLIGQKLSLSLQPPSMKKRHGIDRAPDEVPLSELSEMSTGALLARLKRLRWCYETPEAANDLTQDELKSAAHKILFRSDEKWKRAYGDVKSILDGREHKGNM